MTANGLKQYETYLYGCRFCPMCRPADEVANLTFLEGHTTRARSMMLWRIANDIIEWQPRGVEILYQSTLDSISEAWCVNHYPVSGYMLAARAEVYAAGLAPEPVQRALERQYEVVEPQGNTEVILLAGELADLGDRAKLQTALDALRAASVEAQPAVLPSGALAHSLGATDLARAQAKAVVQMIHKCGARWVIADGPQTLWALKRIYPALDVELPGEVEATGLSAHMAEALDLGKLKLSKNHVQNVFVHDSRSAALLVDSLAEAETIQPGYVGEEEKLGAGAVYDAPRKLIDAVGMERQHSVWSRSLSRSCGIEGGLAHTYPYLAEMLAKDRLVKAKRVGAKVVVTDSPLSAAHMARYAEESELAVKWLPELVIESRA